jgi:hypothetical protein
MQSAVKMKVLVLKFLADSLSHREIMRGIQMFSDTKTLRYKVTRVETGKSMKGVELAVPRKGYNIGSLTMLALPNSF